MTEPTSGSMSLATIEGLRVREGTGRGMMLGDDIKEELKGHKAVS